MRNNGANPAVTASLGTAAVAVLWGTSGALVKHLDLSAAEIACMRAAFGCVALALWLTVHKRSGRDALPKALTRHAYSLLASGVLLAAHWLTFVMALQRAPIGTVLTGIYLAPVAIAALAPRTLGERVSRTKFLGVLVAVAGSALVLRPSTTGGWSGIGITVFSALAYAGSILAGKSALTTASPSIVAFGQLGITALALSPPALAGFNPPSASEWASLAVLGVVYSAVAMLVYLASLRGISATSSAILLCLEPVSGFATGWVFLGERPGVLTAFGAATVLVVGTLTTVAAAREEGTGEDKRQTTIAKVGRHFTRSIRGVPK